MWEVITKYYDESIVWKRAIDIACPQNAPSKTALFYVHGGGWSAGAREHFHHHLKHFSELGYVCASAGYRLVPDVSWQDQLSDVADGYELFMSYIRKQEYDISRIVVIGSSAGAHLASMFALNRRADQDQTPELAACVAINGPATLEQWPDMGEDIRKLIEAAFRLNYSDDTDVFKKASPIHHVGNGSPDFLFILAGNEKYFPHEYTYRMSEKLISHGKRAEVVCIPEANHGFFYELKSSQQKMALQALENFINSYESERRK